MINKSRNESTLEKIYKNLESGMPENKSIKNMHCLMLGSGLKDSLLYGFYLFIFKKIAKFSTSLAFVKPYSFCKWAIL